MEEAEEHDQEEDAEEGDEHVGPDEGKGEKHPQYNTEKTRKHIVFYCKA